MEEVYKDLSRRLLNLSQTFEDIEDKCKEINDLLKEANGDVKTFYEKELSRLEEKKELIKEQGMKIWNLRPKMLKFISDSNTLEFSPEFLFIKPSSVDLPDIRMKIMKDGIPVQGQTFTAECFGFTLIFEDEGEGFYSVVDKEGEFEEGWDDDFIIIRDVSDRDGDVVTEFSGNSIGTKDISKITTVSWKRFSDNKIKNIKKQGNIIFDHCEFYNCFKGFSAHFNLSYMRDTKTNGDIRSVTFRDCTFTGSGGHDKNDFQDMFYDTDVLEVKFQNCVAKFVDRCHWMFNECEYLQTVDMSGINLAPDDCSRMFRHLKRCNLLDLSSVDFSRVNHRETFQMFRKWRESGSKIVFNKNTSYQEMTLKEESEKTQWANIVKKVEEDYGIHLNDFVKFVEDIISKHKSTLSKEWFEDLYNLVHGLVIGAKFIICGDHWVCMGIGENVVKLYGYDRIHRREDGCVEVIWN